jgi:hypothetical protein
VHRLALASLTALALALPSAAHADIGVRGGLEVPLVTHQSRGGVSGSYNFTDSLQPALDVLVSYYPVGMIGFDIEGREGLFATSNGTRTGTAIGPGITLNPPVIPIYVRASLPIHLEPGDVTFGLRGAAGLSFGLLFLHIYLEGALDLSLAGSNVSAFDTQQFSLGAGVWLKF